MYTIYVIINYLQSVYNYTHWIKVGSKCNLILDAGS